MLFLYDSIVAFGVATLAGAFSWLYGGIVADALLPVIPPLTFILVELMLCFPQRHAGETTYEARARVWQRFWRDPLVWVSLAFMLLLVVPFLNKGLCPICDYPQIAAGADAEAPIPFLPYCVNRMHHLNVVMWFVPSLLAMLAVKHSLLKRGKRLLLELIVWNGLALAAVGFIQQVTGAEAPLWSGIFDDGERAYFFSTFGYPNMGGDYFTTLFAIAIGLWRWKFDAARKDAANERREGAARVGHQAFWSRHLMLIPATFFFFAALTTLSRASIILVTILAIVFFVHAFVCLFRNMPKAKRVKASAASLFALVVIALSVVCFMPEDLQREVDTLNATEVLDRVTGKGQYHTRVAFEIWKDAPLFGVGGWGYKHLCIPKMTEKELRNIQQVGGINVHNDYLQFMAEHGMIGFGCIVAIVVMLIWPLGRVWRAMMNSIRFIPPKDQPPPPVAIFVVPAPVFCILSAVVATLIHCFGDCPMRSPAVLSLFFIELAAMDGFLPRVKEK